MDQKQVANAYLRIPIDGGCALACPAVIDQGPTRTNENLDADEVIRLFCKDLIDIHHVVQGNCHPWKFCNSTVIKFFTVVFDN